MPHMMMMILYERMYILLLHLFSIVLKFYCNFFLRNKMILHLLFPFHLQWINIFLSSWGEGGEVSARLSDMAMVHSGEMVLEILLKHFISKFKSQMESVYNVIMFSDWYEFWNNVICVTCLPRPLTYIYAFNIYVIRLYQRKCNKKISNDLCTLRLNGFTYEMRMMKRLFSCVGMFGCLTVISFPFGGISLWSIISGMHVRK